MTSNNYVRIGEAARLAGVSVETLRRWEREGKLLSVRTFGGQRTYSLRQIESLREGDPDEEAQPPQPPKAAVQPPPTPTSIPPWKAREEDAAADLSITRFRIEQAEEVRRYENAALAREQADRAETAARDDARHQRDAMDELWAKQQRELESCLGHLRMLSRFQSATVRAEVERFLADNAEVGCSLEWLRAEVQAILDRHAAAKAEQDRVQREAENKRLSEQTAASMRTALVSFGELIARRLTDDQNEWDGDCAAEAVDAVREHLTESIRDGWDHSKVEREVRSVLAEWE